MLVFFSENLDSFYRVVRAVSFVDSTPAARNAWEIATKQHKRAQALGGAKNYIVVMPDARPEETVAGIVGSSFGCAGERYMASSVLVTVGDCGDLLDKVAGAARRLRVGNGLEKTTPMGPLITGEHKKRVEGYIQIGLDEGADMLLDGRNLEVEGLSDGYYLGPTIMDKVRPDMRIAREEIFGPVLSVMRAKDLDEAIELCNTSEFGNGATMFTSSGGAARAFRNRVQCGMVGINAGVPAPMAFFSFGGHKNSIFGDLGVHGPDAIEFYTQKKSVIERWFDQGETSSIWGK